MKFLLSALAASMMLTAISCHQKSESQKTTLPVADAIQTMEVQDEAPVSGEGRREKEEERKREREREGEGKRENGDDKHADWDKKNH